MMRAISRAVVSQPPPGSAGAMIFTSRRGHSAPASSTSLPQPRGARTARPASSAVTPRRTASPPVCARAVSLHLKPAGRIPRSCPSPGAASLARQQGEVEHRRGDRRQRLHEGVQHPPDDGLAHVARRRRPSAPR